MSSSFTPPSLTDATLPPPIEPGERWRVGSDVPFLCGLAVLGSVYVLLIVAMLVADASFTSPGNLLDALASPQLQYAMKLSLLSCSITAILSVMVAVPLGYLLSRYSFPGRRLLDALLDIPIVLPPLVIGLSLLILFSRKIHGASLEDRIERIFGVGFVYHVPSVVLAQFSVAAAFAVRTMRVTFDQINPRSEQVALTLGATRSQAFWWVVLPEARRGMITALTLAWARSLGEFGPLLIFCGMTEFRTEVLSVGVWAELSIGRTDAAVAVSLLMIIAAVIVLVIVRWFGGEAIVGRVYQP
jgi:molybdate transport system permease protein